MEEQLVEYRGVQEEILNFKAEVHNVSTIAKRLLSEYDDDKREPLSTQVQNQLDSLQVRYLLLQVSFVP